MNWLNQNQLGRHTKTTTVIVEISSPNAIQLFDIYWKLVFYSVISNYRTKWGQGLIKKTGTVAGESLLPGWEKKTDVLIVGALLFGDYLEFGSDVVLCVSNPI